MDIDTEPRKDVRRYQGGLIAQTLSSENGSGWSITRVS